MCIRDSAMSTRNGLGDLLFGRTRGAILALLYGRADQLFYTRQIARDVDASVGAVQRELENLSKVGLIIRSSVGSQVFYQANRHAPIFREMQALVNKTIGIFSVLRSALHPLAKRVLVAFVYGSVAREEETAQSDVDLMVVGKATLDEILSRLSTVEKNIGRPINQMCIRDRDRGSQGVPLSRQSFRHSISQEFQPAADKPAAGRKRSAGRTQDLG